MQHDWEKIANWAADLYEARTTQLALTGKLDITYVHPAYRVTTHEVMARFGLNLAPWMAEFQAAFQKEMRKRKLHLVLKGKMKSEEWYNKYRKG